MSWLTLFYAYLLGGITFIPLLAIAALSFIYYTAEKVQGEPHGRSVSRKEVETAAAKATEVKEVKPAISGWLTVRRTFEPLILGDTYAGMVASSYRSFLDNRSKDPRRTKRKDAYFGVVKRSVLFLYETDPAHETATMPVECVAAIQLGMHDVVIFPEGLIDGELFMRRNAVCLKPQTAAAELQVKAPPEEGLTDNLEASTNAPWFLFPRTCIEKEDWLHALVAGSKQADPAYLANHARDRSLFDSQDMLKLVDGIDRQADPIPTRWLNAMLGRLFLSVYRTAALEHYIVGRIVRKLSRVNKPSFLSDIIVREVNVGSTIPFFGKPLLKELTAEGEASMEVAMAYTGNFRITIETTATISLGARFKPYTVRLVLAIVLKELDGTMVFKLKKPPSNRFWMGFTSPPKMVLSAEPVVSTRQIRWSMILRPIEARIREVVLESIVAPNLDDLTFFDTRKYAHRGGIYGDALRTQSDLPLNSTTHQQEEEDDEDLLLDGGHMAELGTKEDAIPPSLRQRHSLKHQDSDAKSTASAPAASKAEDSATSWTSGTASHAKRKSWFASSSALNKTPSVASASSAPADTHPATPASRSTTTSSSPPRGDGELDIAARLRNTLETDQRGREAKEAKAAEPASPTKRSNSAPPAPQPTADDAPSSLNPDAPVTSPIVIPPTPPTVDSVTTSSAASLHSMATESSQELAETPVSMSKSSTSEGSATSEAGGLPSGPPKLPDRPTPTKAMPIPPPKRQVPSPSESKDPSPSNGPPGNPGLLAGLRAKASDKQALAASAVGARDTVKRWAANWQSARRTGLEGEPGYNPRSTPSPEGSPSTSRQPSEAGRPRSVSTAGNAFLPSPPLPTTSINSSSALSGSPTLDRGRYVSSPPLSTYGPAMSMAIPGIREGHRGGMGPDAFLGASPSKASSRSAPSLPPRSRSPSPSPSPLSEREE